LFSIRCCVLKRTPARRIKKQTNRISGVSPANARVDFGFQREKLRAQTQPRVVCDRQQRRAELQSDGAIIVFLERDMESNLDA
jgi:hypothetical protein